MTNRSVTTLNSILFFLYISQWNDLWIRSKICYSNFYLKYIQLFLALKTVTKWKGHEVLHFSHIWLSLSVYPILIKLKKNPVKNKGPSTRYQNIWFWKTKVSKLIHVKQDICQRLYLLIYSPFMVLAAPFQIISTSTDKPTAYESIILGKIPFSHDLIKTIGILPKDPCSCPFSFVL